MKSLIEKLRNDQSESGSWEYPFEAGTFTDAYMIVLLRTLEINDEPFIKSLVERVVSRQERNGTWKLFKDDGDGNVTSTVEGYYALLYSGYYQAEDERLKKAKRFILANGGIEKTTLLTKIMLTLTGQYQWPKFFPLPIELILLPLYSPVNLFSMSVYGRAHLVPFIVAADKNYQLKTAKSQIYHICIHHQERIRLQTGLNLTNRGNSIPLLQTVSKRLSVCRRIYADFR
ncbi:hypothetical protein [Bacillus sp. JCM 19041]|uniref:hypothetical protein n=1 Tax=Bacillus sp. JCM 19041 TaxID=1460637 RepID=UPI00336A9628